MIFLFLIGSVLLLALLVGFALWWEHARLRWWLKGLWQRDPFPPYRPDLYPDEARRRKEGR